MSAATRYHVLISDDLVSQLVHERLPDGFRLIEQQPRDPQQPFAHWWLVEDDKADPELDGKRVELTITRGRVSEDDLYDRTWISERRVVA